MQGKGRTNVKTKEREERERKKKGGSWNYDECYNRRLKNVMKVNDGKNYAAYMQGRKKYKSEERKGGKK